MEIVVWILVVVLAGVALYLGREAARAKRMRRDIEAVAEDLRAGVLPEDPEGGADESLSSLRAALRDRWAPRGAEREQGMREGRRAGLQEGRDDALRGMARYLEATVTRPLAEAAESGEDLEERAQAAVHALEDLAFFGRDLEAEEAASTSLVQVVSDVTREFARDYEVPVKFLAPDYGIRAPVASEALKDALYLLLVNAVRFGAEDTVQVRLEEVDGRCSLEVVDRGAGFSEEALERALEPFFTTSPDSLGLGLTWVQRVAAFHGGEVGLRNRSDGGAAVELRLPLRA